MCKQERRTFLVSNRIVVCLYEKKKKMIDGEKRIKEDKRLSWIFIVVRS